MANFIEAAKANDLCRIKEMLQHGTAVNCRDPKDSSSALYWAACHGHADLLGFLLQQGADVNLRVKWGSLPIHGAADRGQEECLRLLINSQSNIAAQNENLDTPLHLGACRGNLEVCKILTMYGAPLNIQNKQGKTPMDEARSNQHPTVYQLLATRSLAPVCADIRRNQRRGTIPNHDPSGCHSAPVRYIEEKFPSTPKHSTDPLAAPSFFACPHTGESGQNCFQCYKLQQQAEEERQKTLQSLHENFEEIGTTKQVQQEHEESPRKEESPSIASTNGRCPSETDDGSGLCVVNGNGGFYGQRSFSATDLNNLSRDHDAVGEGREGSLTLMSVSNITSGGGSLGDLPKSSGVTVAGPPQPPKPASAAHKLLQGTRSYGDVPVRRFPRELSPDPMKYREMKELVKKLLKRIEELERERNVLQLTVEKKDSIIKTLYDKNADLVVLHDKSTWISEQFSREKARRKQMETEISGLKQQVSSLQKEVGQLQYRNGELSQALLAAEADKMRRRDEVHRTQTATHWSVPYNRSERALLGLPDRPVGGSFGDNHGRQGFVGMTCTDPINRQRLISRDITGQDTEHQPVDPSPPSPSSRRDLSPETPDLPGLPPSTVPLVTPPSLMLFGSLLSIIRSADIGVLRKLFSALLLTVQSTLFTTRPKSPSIAQGGRRPWKLGKDFTPCEQQRVHSGHWPSWSLPIQYHNHRYVLQVSPNHCNHRGWRVVHSLPEHTNIVNVLHQYEGDLIEPLSGESATAIKTSGTVLYSVTRQYTTTLHSLFDFRNGEERAGEEGRERREKDIFSLTGTNRRPAVLQKFLLQTFYQVLCALDHAARHNIVHQNVTAGSVYFDEDFRAMLGDWHMAKRICLSEESSTFTDANADDTRLENDVLALAFLMNDLLTPRKESHPEGSSPVTLHRFKAVLDKCMEENVENILSVTQARLRAGMLLFASETDSPVFTSEREVLVWLESQMLSRLATVDTLTPGFRDNSEVKVNSTLEETLEVNEDFLQKHFLCSISLSDLRDLCCKETEEQ